MLTGSRLERMLGAWFAALRSLSRRATGEAMLGGEAVLRRLAALGADVSSYLRPVEADREGTLVRLRSLRHDLIDPKFALYKGCTLETTGAVQAARAAAG